MKKIMYLFIVLSAGMLNAQVGINTNTPDPSALLDIAVNNKGVSFPKTSLTAINNPAPFVSPVRSLIVFNTNPALGGGVGFYYWTGAKWNFWFSDLNGFLLQNLTKFYSATNTNYTGYSFTSPADFSNTTNNIGDGITTGWRVVTDLTTPIVIDRPTNDILFTVTGMMQSSDQNGSGNIASAIGFYVDDVLVDIKPIILKVETNPECDFRTFTVYGKTSNLTAGNHTVKIAIKPMISTISGMNITFGGRNTSTPDCSATSSNSLTNDEAVMSSIILINQPFDF